MAKKTSLPSLDLNRAFADLQSQFRGLDPKEPGQWPIAPKVAAWMSAAGLAVLLAWFLVLSNETNALEAERQRESTLKMQYRDKLGQAVNLVALRKQKLQVQEYVTQLERQLPGKAEMDALLSDINQAGLGRGLQFELFRPGTVAVKEYYAELPIAIRVTGQYHDIGAFAADIATLPRIVTLHGLNVVTMASPAGGGTPREGLSLLTLEATAHTYRYLDPSEVQAQTKAQKAAGTQGGK